METLISNKSSLKAHNKFYTVTYIITQLTQLTYLTFENHLKVSTFYDVLNAPDERAI